MNLRSKRLTKGLDPVAAAFLDSTKEDATLVPDDVLGTLAHVASLEQAGILSKGEAEQLRHALTQLHAEAATFTLSSDLEDVHMNVEAWLTKKLGDLGKRVHTGRSRNDQVALGVRLWSRRQLLALADATLQLAKALAAKAHENPDAILPGHTHFQIAQPVLWSHQLGAHVARLARDLSRLLGAYARLNVSPLGAGALAGTTHAIDPKLVARLLAFDDAFDNSLDAVSDRDHIHELLFIQSLILTHVSGLAEELILYSHPAFGFVHLDDAHTTGSSLMPQKKNPDVLEVARAKAATAMGALAASLAQVRALPLAYNRDLQENKRLALETIPAGTATVRAVASTVQGLTIDPDAMLKMAAQGHSDATDLADYLVKRGVPFRDAHEAAARCVQTALAKGCTLTELSARELAAIHPKIGPDVRSSLGPQASVQSRNSPGGTSPKASQAALARIERRLKDLESSFRAIQERITAATQQLTAATKVVKTK